MLRRSLHYVVVGGLLTSLVRLCHAESIALPAEIPFKREGTQDALIFSPWLISTLCVLLLVLCVLRFVVRAKGQKNSVGVSCCAQWRSWFSPSTDSSLRIVASCRLPQGASLQSVEWEGQRLLLSCSLQGVRLLARGVADAPSVAKYLADFELDDGAVSSLHPAAKDQADGR